MHLLYAVHGYKPAYRIGGPIHSVSAVAERLVRAGHRVTVFTTNSNLDQDLDVPVDRPIDVDGVEVWYFRHEEPVQRLLPRVSYVSKSIGYLYAPALKAELERALPAVDLVHTHMPFVYPTFAAGRAALRHHKPLVYHQRGVFDPARLRFRGAKKRAYIRFVERPLMQRAAALIALTDAEVDSYRGLGVSTPIRVVPNGIDVDRYRCRPEADMVQCFGMPADARVVLFMSRVHPIKGADRLLSAFRRVHAAIPNAWLVMAGPDEWGLEAEFRRQAAADGVAARVLFPGMVDGDVKLDLLARADVFCLPSAAEGFSMAVLEALASATPVLLSPGCNFPEVERAGAGRVADTNPATIADALIQLLGDGSTLREMGRRGRELVMRDYSWDRITELMLDTYETIVAERAIA